MSRFKKCIYRLCNIDDKSKYPDIINYKAETNILNNECIICLDKFYKNDNICIIKCGHIYHTSCLYTWFLKKQTCPLCDEILEI